MKHNLAASARKLSLRINVPLLLITMVAATLLLVILVRTERVQLEKSLILTATQVQSAISQSPGAVEALSRKTDNANEVLQPILTGIAAERPSIGLGVYSRAMDSVVAVHPFDPSLLRAASHDYPCFEVYVTGRLKLSTSKDPFDWNGAATMSATAPVFNGIEIVGHVWANVQSQRLYASIAETMFVLFGLWFIAYLSTRKAIWRAFAAIGRDIASSAETGGDGDGLIVELDTPKELSPLLQMVQRQHRALQEESEKKEEAKRSLETLFEISRDYMCIAKDGYLLKVNPAFCEALGYSEQELLSKPYMQFMHPVSHGAVEQQRRRLRRGEALHLQNSYLCADGSVRDISWFAVGHRGTTYATGRDITEQRKLDERLAKLDRLNLAGEMAASISHEIRNPLTTVRGFIQLAKLRGEKTVLDEHYHTLMEELDRANGIITEYLSLAKDKAYTRKKANLNKLLHTLEPLVQAEALMRGHLLVMELADIPHISIDENEIRQMVLNLVKNGLEAMPESGVLTVRTRLREDGVALDIADQGPGIPLEVLQRIPTPFFTTKEQGTGLGLAVCYRIAEHHDAQITISTSSEGTTFCVLFPTL